MLGLTELEDCRPELMESRPELMDCRPGLKGYKQEQTDCKAPVSEVEALVSQSIDPGKRPRLRGQRTRGMRRQRKTS